mmetsp:Transcript_11838/g.38966  ORF Transcript_11838/g.38966 Transcript_11838/m.38966 type:complete len:219 (-) Transcript_11838:519-1175(-)
MHAYAAARSGVTVPGRMDLLRMLFRLRLPCLSRCGPLRLPRPSAQPVLRLQLCSSCRWGVTLPARLLAHRKRRCALFRALMAPPLAPPRCCIRISTSSPCGRLRIWALLPYLELSGSGRGWCVRCRRTPRAGPVPQRPTACRRRQPGWARSTISTGSSCSSPTSMSRRLSSGLYSRGRRAPASSRRWRRATCARAMSAAVCSRSSSTPCAHRSHSNSA